MLLHSFVNMPPRMELMKPFIDQYGLWLENIMGTYCICLIRLKLLSHFLYIQKKTHWSQQFKKGTYKSHPLHCAAKASKKKGKILQPTAQPWALVRWWFWQPSSRAVLSSTRCSVSVKKTNGNSHIIITGDWWPIKVNRFGLELYETILRHFLSSHIFSPKTISR